MFDGAKLNFSEIMSHIIEFDRERFELYEIDILHSEDPNNLKPYHEFTINNQKVKLIGKRRFMKQYKLYLR